MNAVRNKFRSSDTTAPDPAAIEGAPDPAVVLKNLQKRMKSILKEPANKVCSECKSKKPKWMSLLQAPIDAERRKLGVLCCGDCQEYHAALGEELCILKSLKHAEEWTEEDIEILEKSGNAVVNAIYQSALEGKHTDKHIGQLASKAFVESKYKHCAYFSENTFHEQMELRAKLLAEQNAGNGNDQEEEPAPPSTDDLLKKALKRQTALKAEAVPTEDQNAIQQLHAEGTARSVLEAMFSAATVAKVLGEDSEEDEEDISEEVDDLPAHSSRGGLPPSTHSNSHRRGGPSLRRASTATARLASRRTSTMSGGSSGGRSGRSKSPSRSGKGPPLRRQATDSTSPSRGGGGDRRKSTIRRSMSHDGCSPQQPPRNLASAPQGRSTRRMSSTGKDNMPPPQRHRSGDVAALNRRSVMSAGSARRQPSIRRMSGAEGARRTNSAGDSAMSGSRHGGGGSRLHRKTNSSSSDDLKRARSNHQKKSSSRSGGGDDNVSWSRSGGGGDNLKKSSHRRKPSHDDGDPSHRRKPSNGHHHHDDDDEPPKRSSRSERRGKRNTLVPEHSWRRGGAEVRRNGSKELKDSHHQKRRMSRSASGDKSHEDHNSNKPSRKDMKRMGSVRSTGSNGKNQRSPSRRSVIDSGSGHSKSSRVQRQLSPVRDNDHSEASFGDDDDRHAPKKNHRRGKHKSSKDASDTESTDSGNDGSNASPPSNSFFDGADDDGFPSMALSADNDGFPTATDNDGFPTGGGGIDNDGFPSMQADSSGFPMTAADNDGFPMSADPFA